MGTDYGRPVLFFIRDHPCYPWFNVDSDDTKRLTNRRRSKGETNVRLHCQIMPWLPPNWAAKVNLDRLNW